MSNSTKQKKSGLLLVSMIIGIIYLIYSLYYWSTANTGNETDAAAAGAAIATALVFPHLGLAFLALIFNALGFFTNKPAFALTAGILYSVSLIAFPMYFWGVVVELVLCFVAYGMMHKRQTEAREAERYARREDDGRYYDVRQSGGNLPRH